MSKKLSKRIAIAIDKSQNDFNLQQFALQCSQSVILKIGLEYFVKFGSFGLQDIAHDIFLDLKFFDIPNTVYHAVKSGCAIRNVKLMTIHAQGGKKMIESAVLARNEANSNTAIICVTTLTSEAANLNDICRLTEVALKSGADGIVCSAQEIGFLREKFGKDFLAVTPGIRPLWYNEGDDQVRICTPQEAFNNGADIIVIGRPVMRSDNPAMALDRILKEI